MQSRNFAQIHAGMDVVGRDGNRLGKAGETGANYFNLDAGLLGTREYYVPFDAVTDIRENTIVVDASKDDLDRMGWDRRPEAGARTASRASEGRRLELREEELQARTTPVETGRVQVSKEVVEEQRTLEVPVTREEVRVERRPVERRPADAPISPSETETIRVPVREERVEVEKQPVVYEEVGIGKNVTQETQEVTETVRREELRTDEQGDVEVREDPNTRRQVREDPNTRR